MTEVQTIPFNVEAEEALLGSVLINPASFPTIDLRSKDFYIERHRWIWQAMAQVIAGNQIPDHVSLSEKLSGNGKLKEIGGPAFLASLVNRTPSSLHAEQYAEIVRDKSRRRKIIATAHELAVAAYDEKADLDKAAAQATDDLTATVRTSHEMLHISEAIPQLLDAVSEAAENPSETWGIPTGFVDLDRLTGGLLGLWYLAGPPGIGKSILMLQMMINAAKQGHAGAIFSLEMSALSQLMRAVSAEAEIATRSLKTGHIEADEWDAFYKACQSMADLPIYICDEPELSTTQLRAHLVRLKSKIDVEVFALDYLYLMTDDEKMEPTERTELLSKRVKAIQRKLDIPALTVNSVTKEGMKGSPSITDLRGSGQLVHDPDVVIFMNKHDMAQDMRTLSLKKGRDLESLGRIDLVKMGSWPSFKDASERDVKATSAFSGKPVKEPIP